MKIAEVRQIPVNELPERIKEEKAKYQKMLLDHSISLLLLILHRLRMHVVRLLR